MTAAPEPSGEWVELALVSPVGGQRGSARARLEALSMRARLLRAAKAVGLGTVILLVLLPVPGLHFGGAIVFVVALAYAATQLRPVTVLRAVQGTCPACDAAQDFFIGAGLRGVRWPAPLDCGACGKALRLEAPAA